MRNISEAELALSFHNAAGKPIDPGTSHFFLYINYWGVIPNCCFLISSSKYKAVTGTDGRDYFPSTVS